MAWEFCIEPASQRKLDWMREFVRTEIYPLETFWSSIGHVLMFARAIADPGPVYADGGAAIVRCG